ncbi:uncharacterized protein EV154DRAFT_469211 [Mucor mucedo]|uniref:uncharacterized protein n=1 Tax=Mucor mucedo TaxID=29922 RepID=UPI00221EA99B|nr:uncharacterized protein EV154DRAFT_469211 [Mucor mucedo]KAI7888206.1 hypothetical protein EV154DRAFT_469211 [Mucor mucedo]
MSAVKIGYNDQYQNPVDYLCIQQSNVHYIRSTASSIIDEEEQQKRDKLIQAATDRLRQKLLESKYETLMSQIVELQSKLDIIKLETSISLKSMNTNHLDHFEKRLENHKLKLHSIVNSNDKKVEENKTKFSSSLSSFSSTISSILSLRSTSDEDEKDYFASLGHQPMRRRRHSKQQERICHVPIVTIDENYYTKEPSALDTRNALDDTLSFLNDLASDSDDGGFRQDIIHLLDTMHPVHHQQTQPKCFFQTRRTCFVKKALTNIVSSSWKWIRFALIMTLAILINLRKGPSLF